MKLKYISILFILLCYAIPTTALQDTFEGDDLFDNWDKVGTVTMNLQTRVYSSSHDMYLRDTHTTSGGARTVELVPLDYFAFTSVSASASSGYGEKVLLQNELGGTVMDMGWWYYTNWPSNSWNEFVKDEADWDWYQNGVYKATFSGTDTDYGKVYFTLASASAPSYEAKWYIDDFCHDSIVGCDADVNNADSIFWASHGIKLKWLSPDSTYVLNLIDTRDQRTLFSTNLTGYCGIASWDVSDVLGTNYSLYKFEMTKDGVEEATEWFAYTDVQNYGTVQFDSESYVLDEDVEIDYTLVGPDYSTYTYKLEITDLYGETYDTETLTEDSGTWEYMFEDMDDGTYFVLLTRTSKSTGDVQLLDYDYADITDAIAIEGTTYWFNSTLLPNTTVSINQGAAYYNTTSDSNSSYSVDDLSIDIYTTFNANNSDAEAIMEEFSFTPEAPGSITVDLILFPENMTDYWGVNNTTAYGLVYSTYHQPVGGATVTISNATWTNTTTTSDVGFYMFNNLVNGTDYTVNASMSGYITSSDYTVSMDNNTRQDIELAALYTVTIKARDATTNSYISSFDAYKDDDVISTTNGTVYFGNVEYGAYSFTASSDDYYSDTETWVIDENTTITLELERLESQYYSPHYVKYILTNLITRYNNVDVSVYIGSETDESYTGVTGTDGSATFQLSEDTYYRVVFENATQGISRTWTGYPVDDTIWVLVFPTSTVPEDREIDDILFGCYGSEINLTSGYINVSFNDTSSTTTLAELWINDTNQSNLYYFNTTNSTGEWSQVVNASNSSYIVQFKIQNTAMDDPLSITRIINFYQDVRVDLGLENGWNYVFLAVILVVFLAALFSRLNAYIGACIAILGGWFVFFIGWLTAGMTFNQEVTVGVMLLFGTLLAFGSAIRSGEDTI